MNTTELRKQVRQAVKDFGLRKKDVSVKVNVSGYSDVIRVQARHDNIDLKGLHEVLRKFKHVDRCEKSGEILAGGNTYLFIHSSDGRTRNWSDL